MYISTFSTEVSAILKNGRHFEISSGSVQIPSKNPMKDVHTKFHACITKCTISSKICTFFFHYIYKDVCKRDFKALDIVGNRTIAHKTIAHRTIAHTDNCSHGQLLTQKADICHDRRSDKTVGVGAQWFFKNLY